MNKQIDESLIVIADNAIREYRNNPSVPALWNASWAVVQARNVVFSSADPDCQQEANDVADQIRQGGWPNY